MIELESEKIANILKFHRRHSGLTQIDLAKIAGVGKTVIYEIESGKITFQMESLLKIMKVLNISITFSSPLLENYKQENIFEKS